MWAEYSGRNFGGSRRRRSNEQFLSFFFSSVVDVHEMNFALIRTMERARFFCGGNPKAAMDWTGFLQSERRCLKFRLQSTQQRTQRSHIVNPPLMDHPSME